jgi:serine/threonine protein kinase
MSAAATVQSSDSAAVPLMVDPALSSAFPASVAFKPSCDRSKSWSLSDFDIDRKMLGEGRFGRVFRVRHRASRKVCVIKAMEKEAILAEDVLSQLRREVEVHTRLKHPHIIECYGHFQDASRREFAQQTSGTRSHHRWAACLLPLHSYLLYQGFLLVSFVFLCFAFIMQCISSSSMPMAACFTST